MKKFLQLTALLLAIVACSKDLDTNTVTAELSSDGHTYGEAFVWNNLVFKINSIKDNSVCVCGMTSNIDKCSFEDDIILPEYIVCENKKYIVTAIRYSAFSNMSKVTSIKLPETLIEIGLHAFSGCNSLQSITIPDSVTQMGESAFGGCSKLSSVTFGKGLTSLPALAFSGCESLVSIDLPENITYIGKAAFNKCTGITSIVTPDTIKTIDSNAFTGCYALTNIVIGSSIESLGENLIWGCHNIKSVTIKTETPPAAPRNVFQDAPLDLKIRVPKNAVDTYKNDATWKYYSLYLVTILR